MFRPFKNNLLNIRLRNLSDSNQAVVGIVVAVLLIGLVVTILSVIQLIYVPNWMEEIESEHIDEVFNQFCQLKMVIDTQSSINQTLNPIVTSINLGTNKIPFFMATRAAGGLDIITFDDSNANTITITNTTGNTSTYRLGTIKYTSANAYYIPEEQISFVYENGALITDQKTDYSLNIKPAFTYDELSENISFNIVNISGVGGKISKSGYNIDHIRTELYKNEIFDNKINYTDDLWFLNITTNYPDIWYSFINSVLRNSELIEGENENENDYDIDINGNIVSIEFFDSSGNPGIKLKRTGIYAQIGPGWIDIE